LVEGAFNDGVLAALRVILDNQPIGSAGICTSRFGSENVEALRWLRRKVNGKNDYSLDAVAKPTKRIRRRTP